jgi:hypothetical protein
MFERNDTAELHPWVEARLSAHIDNQLPTAERTHLEQHIGECARCRASLESLRWTIALVKQAPVPASSRSFTLPVPARREPASFAFGFARFATALATLLLFAIIGVDLISHALRGGAAAPAMAPSAAKEIAAPTQAVALAPMPTQSVVSRAEPTPAPKPSTAPVFAPPPAAPSPAAPATAKAPESALGAAEVSPTQSVADTAQKSQGATPPARQPATGGVITATIPAPIATLEPTATVQSTATLAPTIVAQARTEPTRGTVPTSTAPAEPIVSLLRVVEIGLLFAAFFFGVLMVLLGRRK